MLGLKDYLFGQMQVNSNPDSNLVDKTLRDVVARLRRQLVWLPVLDMELLPLGAKLLTSVLVWLLTALDSRFVRPSCEREFESESERYRPSSTPVLLREEGLDDPWMHIEGLNRDATQMWQSTLWTTDPWLDTSFSGH